MEAELPNLTEITRHSTGDEDVPHLCGFHAKIGWQRIGIQGFFSRVLRSPKVIALEPRIEDYIHWVLSQTRNAFLYDIRPISEYDRKSRHAWRKNKPTQPMAEVYPFVSGTPTEDHEMLLAVDRLVPKHLSSEVRADVCQDIIVALLTGETTIDNIRDGPSRYIRQVLKQSPSKYGHLSLDAPTVIGDNSSRTVGEGICAHR